MRKLILYIATSLDGYIAESNEDLNFLSIVEKQGEDYGYADFISTIDTILIGRKTYDWILNHANDYLHTDKESFVITRTERPSLGNTHFYTDNIKDLVTKLKSEQGATIFCDGGAELVNELLKDNLIDEFIISIMIGEGIRLFKDGRPQERLELISSKSFDTGLVQLHYKRIDN